MAINPIALGILTGSISGAAMGLMTGNPVGVVVGATAGAITGGIAASEKQRAELGARAQLKDEKQGAVNNQNALVEDAYKKKQGARGIGTGGATSPSGNAASQTGSVLTSTAGTSSNSILG